LQLPSLLLSTFCLFLPAPFPSYVATCS
jgi:hypothetical protein